MPDKDYSLTEPSRSQQASAQPQSEQLSQAEAALWPAPDTGELLASLKLIFAAMKNQLQGEASESAPPETMTAINKFNAIVARLRFNP